MQVQLLSRAPSFRVLTTNPLLGKILLSNHSGGIMTEYEKMKIALRYWLLGKEFYQAADALEFASSYHIGTRKDGETPEFQHQIEMAHYVRTLLPFLLYPEDTISAVLLHDTPEDYNVPTEIIASRFNDRVALATELMNKHRWKSQTDQFLAIAENPIASIVKGADRMHNIQTMVDVFTVEKQIAYIKTAETLFIPMLKSARRRFPMQEPAYENIKLVLLNQIELIKTAAIP